MWREVERRHLASAQKVGNVFHLHKRHGRLLELDAGGHGMIDESTKDIVRSSSLMFLM
jgi:hypothetical protein